MHMTTTAYPVQKREIIPFLGIAISMMCLCILRYITQLDKS